MTQKHTPLTPAERIEELEILIAEWREENLEWVTQSENQIHAYRTGLQRGYKKSGPISECHKRALCGSRWKNETHIYKLEGLQFSNLWAASAHFKVSRQTILNRCKSGNWPQWTKSIEREGECLGS